MDFETLKKIFNDAIMKIKKNKKSTANDFTTLEKIESMLYLNKNRSCHGKV